MTKKRVKFPRGQRVVKCLSILSDRDSKIHISNSPICMFSTYLYSKTCVKQPLSKRPKIGFQDQLSLNAGQTYCRMLQGEHSAILLTFIKVRKRAKIKNRYSQVPHLTQDTNGKVTTSQLDITNESQKVSPFPAGDHKASINRRA